MDQLRSHYGTFPTRVTRWMFQVGSLWFAAVLLMLWLVAMAYATVYESAQGTERALWTFYGSWWFTALLALLCLNIFAAVVARVPFNRHQIGFVLTHLGIVITLTGAAVTGLFALDGQLGLVEGQSGDEFRLGDREALFVRDLSDDRTDSWPLDSAVSGGFDPKRPDQPQTIVTGSATIDVVEYIPNTLADASADDVRIPAVKVKLTAGGDDEAQTLQLDKYRSRRISLDGVPLELTYSNLTVSLGFDVKLNRFRIGYYPGGRRPRSFESQVTVTDPATGAAFDRIISMNHPLSHGGFTLYQSSYRLDGRQAVSFLSVSRDPGQPIAFAGYIMTMVGMVVVIVTRMRQHSARAAAHESAPVSLQGNGQHRLQTQSASNRARATQAARIDHEQADMIESAKK